MTSRVCICCGESFAYKANTLSRNPNICASCSSLADGMEEPNLPEDAKPMPNSAEASQTREDSQTISIRPNFPV